MISKDRFLPVLLFFSCLFAGIFFIAAMVDATASTLPPGPPTPSNPEDLAWDNFTGLLSQDPPYPNDFNLDVDYLNTLFIASRKHMKLEYTSDSTQSLITSKDLNVPASEKPRYLAIRMRIDLGGASNTNKITCLFQSFDLDGTPKSIIGWDVTPNTNDGSLSPGWEQIVLDLESLGTANNNGDLRSWSYYSQPNLSWNDYGMKNFRLCVGNWSDTTQADALSQSESSCTIDKIAFVNDYSNYAKQVLINYFPAQRTPEIDGGSSWTWYVMYQDVDPDFKDDMDHVRWSGNAYSTTDKKEVSGALYPTSGLYSVSDEHAQEYEVLLCKMAGLDGFIYDFHTSSIPLLSRNGKEFYPPPSFQDLPLSTDPDTKQDALDLVKMIAKANGHGFRVGVDWANVAFFKHWYNYDMKDGIQHWNREHYIKQAKFDLKWLLHHVYWDCEEEQGHDCGVRSGITPIIPIFAAHCNNNNSIDDRWFYPEDVIALREEIESMGKEVLLLTRSKDGSIIDEFSAPDVVNGHWSWLPLQLLDSANYTPPYYPSIPLPLSHYLDSFLLLDYLGKLNTNCKEDEKQGYSDLHMASASHYANDHKELAWGDVSNGVVKRRYVNSENGYTLESMIDHFYDTDDPSGADKLLLISLNDHTEGHALEPTIEHGYTYLNAVANKVLSFRGASEDIPTDSYWRLPERLFRIRKTLEFLEKFDNPSSELSDQIIAIGSYANDAAQTISNGLFETADGYLKSAESEGDYCLNEALSKCIKVVLVDYSWHFGTAEEEIKLMSKPELSSSCNHSHEDALPLAQHDLSTPPIWIRTPAYFAISTETSGGEPSPQDVLQSGNFKGQLSFEYWDNGDDQIQIYVDYSDGSWHKQNLILQVKKRDSGQWRKVETELVNARFGNHSTDLRDYIGPTGNFTFAIVDTDEDMTEESCLRSVRIRGLVYIHNPNQP